MSEVLQIPHVIARPTDEKLLEKLRRKLEEYKERCGEYTHPELQLLRTPNAFFKARILKIVLDEGQAEVEALAKKIHQEFPEAFEQGKTHFLDAWGVIWDYCANAGEHTVIGKTGKFGLAQPTR